MKSRGLSSQFLSAMRKKLEKRRGSFKGWDEHWENVVFPMPPMQWMIMRLHQEIDELILAIDRCDPEKILYEAADVANFAMFIADISQDETKTP